jgi:hypothetical protein
MPGGYRSSHSTVWQPDEFLSLSLSSLRAQLNYGKDGNVTTTKWWKNLELKDIVSSRVRFSVSHEQPRYSVITSNWFGLLLFFFCWPQLIFDHPITNAITNPLSQILLVGLLAVTYLQRQVRQICRGPQNITANLLSFCIILNFNRPKVGSYSPRTCIHVKILIFLHYGDSGRLLFHRR